jgi:uncharacterized protein (DUF362 family)
VNSAPSFTVETPPVKDVTFYLDRLAAQSLPDGGWGYTPGQKAHLEPTCVGLLALSLDADRYGPALDRSRQALDRWRGPDGFYRLERGREEAVWPTSLALFVLCHQGYPAEAVKQTAAGLVNLQGRHNADNQAEDLHDINLKLIGWPWADGNFSWAEPTAWACLALRRAGFGGHGRVEEGVRLLLDRAQDEGGINYGNRRILGYKTEPIPGPTALMLLALQGHGDNARVVAAVEYLGRHNPADGDVEHLCWAKLALDAHRGLPAADAALEGLDDLIRKAQDDRADTNYLTPNPLRDALTALALGTDRGNPFRLKEERAEGPATLPLAGAAGAKRKQPLGERLKSAFRGLAVQAVAQMKPLPPQTDVHVAKASDYNGDLADVLGRQFEQFRDRVPLKGKRVVLKPNLVEYHRDKVINTDPRVVAAVIELCRREGAAEVIVAEGPGHWRNVEYLVRASGLGDVLRHYKVPFVDLNHDEPVKTPNMGRYTKLEYLYLSRTVATAEVLISLPKLKTHHWAGATLSLKNLFGIVPGICYGWPKNELHWRGIDNSIADIALTRTPDLAIVDGIVGMEGDGPLNGTARPFGAMVMGCDPLAVDATCCRLMQLNPERMGYMVLGARKKLGLLRETEIRQAGETIAEMAQPFDTLPQFQPLYLNRSA